MYCTQSTEVKPKTVSHHNQKYDTMAKLEKSSSSPHTARGTEIPCHVARAPITHHLQKNVEQLIQ
jgi:hypothetical protein